MKENAIYYSAYLSDKWWKAQDTIACLMYSLETHKLFVENGNYDIVVYIDDRLNIKHKLLDDFPWVKFEAFHFNENDFFGNVPFHKWTNFIKFANTNYKKVILLDCDTYITKDPSYIFDKYNDDKVYALYESWVSKHNEPMLFDPKGKQIIRNGKTFTSDDVLGFRGFNSGSVLMTTEQLRRINSTTFEAMLKESATKIKHRGEALVHDGTLHEGYIQLLTWHLEQYGSQDVLIQYGFMFEEFDRTDVNCELNNQPSTYSTISHYISHQNMHVVPMNIIEKFKEVIIEGTSYEDYLYRLSEQKGIKEKRVYRL